jgi:glycosyltransferase involved in cell wall biosynthesis
MTKEALVIHPVLSVYAGGEFLCIYLCKILQGFGYHVTLVSDVFEPSKVEDLFGMGQDLSHVHHVQSPQPHNVPRFLLPLDRLLYTMQVARFANKLEEQNFDVIFSTQSSIYYFPGRKLYHFVYEITDLFNYPMPLARGSSPSGGRAKRTYFRILKLVYGALSGQPIPDWFFVTGQKVLQSLKRSGYQNSSFFFPPSRVFEVRLPKERRIVQACRIAPEKRIEFMFEVAKRLPNLSFVLAGKNLAQNKRSNPGYGQRLLQKRPANVTYTETLIRDNPDLLQRSKVYFHTGLEKGILLVLLEALSAGCILVVPEEGVAGEVVRAAGVGYMYRTVDEAVEKLKTAMEGGSPWTPSEISQRARKLGPEGFVHLIARVLTDSPAY